MRHAENALDRADSPADTCSDRAAHHAADRPGYPVALGRPLLRASDDALGVAGVRQRDQRQCRRGHRQGQRDTLVGGALDRPYSYLASHLASGFGAGCDRNF